MSEIKTIITRPGDYIDFETVFELNPDIAEGVPSRKGHMERVDYTTEVYEYGIKYPKYCNVYLPYCYDPEDKDRKYNVLYYQHGNTCDPEIFNTPEEIVKFDNLFDSGEIEPCIIVSTTYYMDTTKDVELRKTRGSAPAGDGNSGWVPANFYREVIEDIIPAVEMKYNTYLAEPTKEAMIASRDHRAFSGYSRGAVCTWYMFHNAYPFFRWWGPMSCMTRAGKDKRDEITEQNVIDYLEMPIRAFPELPFFIYATNGGEKDVVAMTEQLKYITKAEGFSYGKDTLKNNIYFSRSEFPHTDYLVPYYYYNSLKVLFRL